MPPADVAGRALAADLVAGISKAETLLQRVCDNSGADLVLGVLGPGGCGKSALLTAVRVQYAAAGVPVVGLDAVLTGSLPAGAAVVIDDVHLLPAEALQQITELVAGSWGKVVVSFRPWPRTPALTGLASLIRRAGPLTVLKHLDRTEVDRRATVTLGRALQPDQLELLFEQSAGHPMVLDEALATVRELGLDLDWPEPRLIAEVIDRLRFLIEDLDPSVRALLRGIAAGAKIEIGVLSELLELDPGQVRDTVETARASGLLLADGRLVPLFRAALRTAESVEGTRDLQVRLLEIHAGRGHDVLPVAQVLARSGIRNQRAAALLAAAGDAQLHMEPAIAAVLYADAVRAGASADDLAVRRAEAAFSIGRFDEALQLADPIIAGDGGVGVERAIDVVAAVMAHRGQCARAADLYRWLGPERIGAAASMAALAFIAVGELTEARTILDASKARYSPTMLAGAMASISEGLQSSLTGSSTSALSALNRAAAMFDSFGSGLALLDSPAALTGLVAIQVGEFDLAESALRRALSQQGAGSVSRSRHLLLLAWIAMVRGQDAEARGLVAEAVPAGSCTEPRDGIFAAAVGVGLARRSGDPTALSRTWHAAREAILLQPIDLFVLLPLGEFVVAAAVMGESRLLDTQLTYAWQLLDRLGNPEVWFSPLKWSALQAAAVSHSREGVAAASSVLEHVSLHNGYGRALAAAGRSWADVTNGLVDRDQVREAAAGLESFGLRYEAALLLSEAATRTGDRRATTSLLHLARNVRECPDMSSAPAALLPAIGRPDTRVTTGHPTPVRPPDPTDERGASRAVLSGRELQVARLLLRNQTYREIGERLFISPKTVEHHVARMKQRVGASRRSELFTQLRALTDSLDS